MTTDAGLGRTRVRAHTPPTSSAAPSRRPEARTPGHGEVRRPGAERVLGRLRRDAPHQQQVSCDSPCHLCLLARPECGNKQIMTTTDGTAGAAWASRHLDAADASDRAQSRGVRAKAIEEAGFRSVWFPGVNAAENLAALEPVLAATSRLVVGHRHRQRLDLVTRPSWRPRGPAGRGYPGRFVLGLGDSHAPLVESMGQAYVRPLRRCGSSSTSSPRRSRRPCSPRSGRRCWSWPGTRTHGAHPYFIPPEHTVFARSSPRD